MSKKLSKAERLAFAQGCKVGARNAKRASTRRSSNRTRARFRTY